MSAVCVAPEKLDMNLKWIQSLAKKKSNCTGNESYNYQVNELSANQIQVFQWEINDMVLISSIKPSRYSYCV